MTATKADQIILFLITFIFYCYFIRPPDWNIASRLSLVKAVVEEHRLEIDSYHAAEFKTGDKAFVNGHYYSDKPLGASLLGIIAYWPIYLLGGGSLPTELFVMLITGLAIGLPTALLAPLMYGLALKLSKNRWLSLIVTLCICLGTPIFPYAGAFYGHSLAAVFSFAVFVICMEINQFDAPITPARLFLSSFLLGYMVLTEYPAVLMATILAAYLLYIVRSRTGSWDWKTLNPFCAGAAITIITLAAFNWASYGSPFQIGYANEAAQEFVDLRKTGVLGIGLPNPLVLLYMTIHPQQGIFLQSPILLLGVAGIFFARRLVHLRTEFIVVVSLIVVHFLAISGAGYWWGGDAFTVRYLIPVLPFFGVFLVFIPKRFLPLMLALGSISIFHMLVASATLYHFMDQMIKETLERGFDMSWDTSLLYSEMIPKLMKNRLTWTWGKYLFAIDSWYFNFALPILAALGLLLVFYTVGRRADQPPVRTKGADTSTAVKTG